MLRIRIVAPGPYGALARELARALTSAFPDLLTVIEDDVALARAGCLDLLVYLYDAHAHPELTDMLSTLMTRGEVLHALPVAIGAPHSRPPGAFGRIRALDVAAGDPDGIAAITRRALALLELKLRHTRARVFLSYTTRDGAQLAEQLDDALRSRGFHPWRDTQRHPVDGEENILPGQDVQQVIEANIDEVAAVFLVDTPGAPISQWVRREVVLAQARVKPIFSLLCRLPGEALQGSRFRQLREFPRFHAVDAAPGEDFSLPRLADAEVQAALDGFERFLNDISVRRRRLQAAARDAYLGIGYGWRRRSRGDVYLAENELRTPPRFLNACSILDFPAEYEVARLVEAAQVPPFCNYRLLILLNVPEDEEQARLSPGDDVILCSHAELPARLSRYNGRPN